MTQKILVYVTQHSTVEVDLKEVKELYGSKSKLHIEEYAFENVNEQGNGPYMTEFEFDLKDVYDDAPVVKKVKKGIGSY